MPGNRVDVDMGKSKRGKKGRSKPHPGPRASGRKSDGASNDSEGMELVSLVKHKGGPAHSTVVPGLSNLGNTCFFNAVMQNIGQSHYFRVRLADLMKSPSYDVELKLQNSENMLQLTVIGDPGPLTSRLHDFLSLMHGASGRTLNPKPVFSEICKKASRFAGYKQQDSQELLRYLLDSLRNEEIDRIKLAILRSFGVSKTSLKQLTDKHKTDIRMYGMQALMSRTFVDEVFGGMLVSTVKCDVCGNCTAMQESFLDLSLPIAEDKQNVVDTDSLGGYRLRGKKNQKSSEAEEDNTQFSKDESVFQNQKASKHQKKKMRHESRKAAKKANRTTKNIHEFQQTKESNIDSSDSIPISTVPGSPPTSPLEGDLDRTEPPTSPLRQELDLTEPPTSPLRQELDLTKPSASPIEKQNSNPNKTADATEDVSPVDPATGEPSPVVAATDSTCDVAEDDPVASLSPCTSNYASSGPQNDTEMTSHELAEDSTRDVLVERVDGLNLDDLNTNDSTVAENEIEGSKCAGGVATQEKHGLKISLDCKTDSLLFSLKQFCSPEMLTGENRFACAVCTSELANKVKTQCLSGDEKAVGDMASPQDAKSYENIVIEDVMASEDDLEVECNPEVGVATSGNGSEVLSTDDPCSDEREAVLQGSSNLGAGEADQPENSEPELEHKIAFCDATKQLLIQTPPQVLTLHLKRFSHHGKRLKKNSKLISFPVLLNLRPFCTDHCQGLCDRSGRLMYSLYGVVVHGGAMQNGHYTAYTRTRTINHTQTTPTGRKQETRPSDSEEQTCAMESLGSDSDCEECSSTHRSFDFSSTQGQWYHASDTHIRTATEAEVLKTQAYLLFYEKLPFVHHGNNRKQD